MTQAELAQLKAAIKHTRWALEELTYDQKQQEASALVSGSPKEMVQYLAGKFGSVGSVLMATHDLRKTQGGRAKTLFKG
jgi:hypothetical protein